MIEYFIEFAILHLVFFGVYKVFLRQETQLNMRRWYLILSSLLALVVPLIELPNLLANENLAIVNPLSHVILLDTIPISVENSTSVTSYSWFEILYIGVSLIISARLIIAIIQISKIRLGSSTVDYNGTKVFINNNLESSFTFLYWVFIGNKDLDKKEDVIEHEKAHVSLGHGYDLIFMNLLTIPFWWLPSTWLMLREIRHVHEYQADQFVLQSVHLDDYKQSLISNTLARNNMILTNSFNDAPLTKRLKYMKKLKENIRPWKIFSITTIIGLSVYVLSCQEASLDEIDYMNEEIDRTGEIFMKVSDPAAFPGGIDPFYDYVKSNLKYPKKAVEAGITGKIFVEMIVNKDGSISDLKILRGLGFGCDEAAISVIKNSPKWNPAKHNGVLVRQKMVLPITFKLANSDQDTEESKSQIAELKLGTTFPGGIKKFMEYVSSNIEYPVVAKNNGIEGIVNIEFTVDIDGSIKDVKVLKGIGSGCDEEALRIIKNSPNWVPKEENGNKVPVIMVVPVRFKL